MPWTPAETTSNTFTRPFGTNEAFIKLSFWDVQSSVSFVRSPAKTHLLRLVASAFQRPSLAAHPDASNSNVVYTVPGSSDALQAWISQAFIVMVDADCADVLIPTITPTPYAQLYYIPQASQLLLQTAHWRIDGVSGLLLLD
ncbi:hypothetical protein ETB97_004466 [Aspergillus alliaceus]|uniref:Uncharacterized protein n=1 Tax=Petromyces alliaceus TaxID=209559 RepID=A0A8H6E3P6_PETAA|nr:hypothetical protein ETB97_004466 [Aspergillus burnettii]